MPSYPVGLMESYWLFICVYSSLYVVHQKMLRKKSGSEAINIIKVLTRKMLQYRSLGIEEISSLTWGCC